MFQVSRVILPENEKPSKPATIKEQIVPVFKPPLLKTTIILATLFIFQIVASFKIWLPTIANKFMQILKTGEGTNLTLCDIIRTSHDTNDVSTIYHKKKL